MEVHQADAPDHIVLTEAGIVGGKIGVNEHGIALTLNGLVTSADGEHPFRMPYHVRFRKVLNATRLSETVGAVISTNRACSANVLLGSEVGELLNLEVLPEAMNYVYPDDGVLTHANHLEKPANAESQFEQLLPDTICRAPRLRRLLQMEIGDLSPATLGNALGDHFDHPTSICRHPNPAVPECERSITRVSAIIDIAEQRIHFTDGPPCESKYREYSLS
jgi:isopenicillin-N N-acyltransferase-like protein